jgi:fatty acid-binding protein DegV
MTIFCVDLQIVGAIINGIANIGALFGCKPSLAFNDSEQGIVVNRGMSQNTLIRQLFIESLG